MPAEYRGVSSAAAHGNSASVVRTIMGDNTGSSTGKTTYTPVPVYFYPLQNHHLLEF
jgi:hypothetical protein